MQNIILKSCQRAALASALALGATSAFAVTVEPNEPGAGIGAFPLGFATAADLNGTFATATHIDASGIAQGAIGDLINGSFSQNDRDFYAFTLDPTATLTVTLEDPTGPGNNDGQFKPAIAIFNENMIPVGGLQNPGQTAGNSVSISYSPAANNPNVILPNNLYYIMITSFQNEGTLFGTSSQLLRNTGYWNSQFVSWSPQTTQNIGLTSFDYQLTLAGAGPGPNAVPVPAAVWLMGSGLLGLVGVARRRKNT